MSLSDAAALILREVDQLAALRDENNLLRARVTELEEKVGNEKQVDNLLIQIEEKDAVINQLRLSLREAREAAKRAGALV